MQFVDEIPDAPYEIRIYCGADGAFTLYEDAGDGYGYERGESARIRFSWNDSRNELMIGARQGSFPGLVASREYHLIFISSRGREGKTVNYAGIKVLISV
jgi:alpha-D-xyloside xylohydrolase